MRSLPLLVAATLVACAPAEPEESPDAGDVFTPSASFTVAGAVNGAADDPAITLVARETRTDTFTVRTLELTLADPAGGTLAVVLSDSSGGSTFGAGAYVRANSTRLVSEATWTASGATWEGNPLADEDPSVVTVASVEWGAGGRVAGELALTLQSTEEASRMVTITGAFDVTITSGP